MFHYALLYIEFSQRGQFAIPAQSWHATGLDIDVTLAAGPLLTHFKMCLDEQILDILVDVQQSCILWAVAGKALQVWKS